MYTQCPDCATVFRITADALRAANGDVRCGVCSTSFNALEELSERPFQAAARSDSRDPEDTMTVEETPGTEVIELSSAVEAPAAAELIVAGPGYQTEFPADLDPVETGSLEFDGDDAELERMFVEMPITKLRGFGAEPAQLTTARDTDDPGAIAAALTIAAPASFPSRPRPEDPADDQRLAEKYLLMALAERDGSPEAAAARTAPAEVFDQSSRVLIPEEMRRGLADEAAARANAARDFADPEPPPAAGRHWPWVAAIAALVLLLGAQVVDSRREDLLRQPVIGPLLARVYAFAGWPLFAPADLAAFELRQWGAASDANQPGRLRLRASIVNRASFAQPYPLLRLALQDRFGTTIGAREVAPGDYLPGTTASSLLGPGQRADAEILIVDPGSDAVGFELDVCMPSGERVHCASDLQQAGRP